MEYILNTLSWTRTCRSLEMKTNKYTSKVICTYNKKKYVKLLWAINLMNDDYFRILFSHSNKWTSMDHIKKITIKDYHPCMYMVQYLTHKTCVWIPPYKSFAHSKLSHLLAKESSKICMFKGETIHGNLLLRYCYQLHFLKTNVCVHNLLLTILIFTNISQNLK